MMKKYISVLLLLCIICAFAAGCGGASAKTVDLTVLSSTLLSAELTNMTTNPGKYMGKTIKVRGPYAYSYWDETDTYYHCVVAYEDVAACCSQALEFIWTGEHSFPGDYPEEGTMIELTGVFGSYQELGKTYYCLRVDKITVLQ